LVLLWLLLSHEAKASWFLTGSGHGTLLSGLGAGSLLAVRFGGGVGGGWRAAERWGVVGGVEWNGWVATELSRAQVLRGALNVGVGPELRWAEDRVRASLRLGPSVLLTRTLLDAPGSVGLFVDLTPAQFAWRVGALRVTLSALSVSIVAPVLRGIPLVDVQFRSTVGLEGVL
jgi:hypothetical protein